MDNKTIGRFIQQLRIEKNYTQQELADILGVSNKTISKWECGRGCPDISMLESLSSTLEVSIVEILNGKRQTEKENNDMILKTSIDYSQKSFNEKSKYHTGFMMVLGLLLIVLISLYAPVIKNVITRSHWTTPKYAELNKNEEVSLKTLEPFKTPYVGDNSKVGNLVSCLPMRDYGYSIEILSDEYGLNIYYHNVRWNINHLENDSLFVEKALLFNTLALFTYIDNLEHISFYFSDAVFSLDRDTFNQMFNTQNKEEEYRLWLEDPAMIEDKLNNFTLKESNNES